MLGEFEFIQNIKKKYSLEKVGDDCAVLPKDEKTDQVITADLMVEDIDFRLEWTTPELLGHKALAVSLSDIAAMGAEPKWALLSLGVPEKLWNSDFIDKFYDGWFALAKEFEVELVGGDVSRTPDKIVIDSIIGGEVPKGKAILRSGAKVGDSIYLTGGLGGASMGLKLLNEGARYSSVSEQNHNNSLLKQLAPAPQVAVGKWLQKNGIATAMIDISDGLSSDLNHICRASGVGAKIYADLIPLSLHSGPKLSIGERLEILEKAINGGEDFELLFTSREKHIMPFSQFARIGEITASDGIVELITFGQSTILEPKGYRHF